MSDEQLEKEVAAALGVEAETVELPPEITRGVILFEFATGEFGFRPLEGTETSLDDAVNLAQRLVTRGIIQMTVAQILKGMEPKPAKKGLLLPNLGLKR
jgi:hypothetical protein